MRITLASVINFTKTIYNGVRNYPYPVPLTLGSTAIGRVVALGPDATALKVGDLCFLDVTIRGRDDIDRSAFATFLSAMHEGMTPGSRRLMADVWRDGCYAEFVRWPLENCFKLDEDKLLGPDGLGYTLEDLMFIPRLMVPYGGLSPGCIDLKPGETVVVSPATGGFGSAAVHLCLELGAGKVICMGRNKDVLERLKDGAGGKGTRVECVSLTGDWEGDLKGIETAAGSSPVDVFFDISPPAAGDSGHFKAGIMALRNGGRVCLMGGHTGDVSVPLPKIMRFDLTLKGKWMYEPRDVKRMINLVETGVVRLNKDGDLGAKPLGSALVGKYKLEEWEKAFDEAEKVAIDGMVLIEP